MISIPGLLGFALGLYVGWLNLGILNGFLKASIEKKRTAGDDKGRASLEKAEPALRKLIFVITVIGLPIVGYLTGSAISG